MKILVLRHEFFEDLGFFADAFRTAGVSCPYYDLSSEIVTGKNDAVVILGGPMSSF